MVALLLFLGAGVGFLSGLFGVGGGFLLTPLLHLALGVPYPIAVGSGACQMVGAAASAYRRYQRLDVGEPRVGWIMLGGSLLGAYLGAAALQRLVALGVWEWRGVTLPAVKWVLQPSFVLVLLWIAGVMAADVRRARDSTMEEPHPAQSGPLARLHAPPFVDLPRVGLQRVSIPVLAYLGLGLGFLSGLFGIGGGILLMPALLYGFGFSVRQAAATGILPLGLSVAAATFQHALAGNVDLALALPLLVGSSVGAQFGALAARRFPGRLLRIWFAWLLLGAALALGADLLRALAAQPTSDQRIVHPIVSRRHAQGPDDPTFQVLKVERVLIYVFPMPQ